ncbi:hypothetical protein [Streptomyces sp. NPDC003717]|uniref:hypothetical protein n=1 Tax=Streptomyces sp. NPDC003717 TaxID=3154276 RepID=UPI0033B8BB9A
MRRGLVHVLAWLLATGAAVTLSWWGVHTVLAGTAYDAPLALPVKATGASTPDARPPSPSQRPTAPPRPKPTPTPTSRATPTKSAPAPSRTPTPTASPTSSGQVRGYDTDGGRAVFDLGTSSASLVSATPKAGWSMRVWKTETWIRVEFAAGTDRVSVFCTWHDGPPRVEVGNY